MTHPSWQPMETAPKDRKILAVWEYVDSKHVENGWKDVGITRFNGIFEATHPGSGYWYGLVIGGRVSSRDSDQSEYSYKPIAWMELPSIGLENV